MKKTVLILLCILVVLGTLFIFFKHVIDVPKKKTLIIELIKKYIPFKTKACQITPAVERKADGVHIPEGMIEHVVKHFEFSEDKSLEDWEEKILKGRVGYCVDQDVSQGACVKATSEDAASALYYRIKLDVGKHPVISWKWRVEKFPDKKQKESIELKAEEDFAARVYVIFPASFFTNSKVVEYIWTEELPVGESGSSAYSKNIKMLVLRSGPSDGGWMYEERDIVEDFIKLFGEEPRLDIGAIAFMTDADSTATKAVSFYDEIKIGYKSEVKENEI